jgi:DNA polymerase III epsilon subunit family exonuclease
VGSVFAACTDLEFAVVDVETTGLSPAFGDRVCEIALVHAQGNEEKSSFSTLINPGRPISPGAAAVNGITPEMIADAPTFQEVAPQIVRHLTNRVFVAHNAPFDLGFLALEFQRLSVPLPFTQVVDTLALARLYYTFAGNSLGAIAEHLNLAYPRRHRALDDARVTWQVLAFFLHDLARRQIATAEGLMTPVAQILSPPRADAIPLPSILSDALTNGLSLEIRYVTVGLQTSVRRVDPIAVVPNRDYFYLRAYCHLRQDERTFRLDRITEMRVIGKRQRATS